MKRTTVKDRIDVLVHQAGSLRAASKVVKVPHIQLHRMRHNQVKHISDETLKKLGLIRITTFYLEG